MEDAKCNDMISNPGLTSETRTLKKEHGNLSEINMKRL